MCNFRQHLCIDIAMPPSRHVRSASGERIPHSGLYEVSHELHLLPSQVTLLKDRTFPPCAACETPVGFTLVRRMDHLDKLKGHVVLHVIPVLPEKAA